MRKLEWGSTASTRLVSRLVNGCRHGVWLETSLSSLSWEVKLRILQNSVWWFLILRRLTETLSWYACVGLASFLWLGSFWLIEWKIWIFETLDVGGLLGDLVVIPIFLHSIQAWLGASIECTVNRPLKMYLKTHLISSIFHFFICYF